MYTCAPRSCLNETLLVPGALHVTWDVNKAPNTDGQFLHQIYSIQPVFGAKLLPVTQFYGLMAFITPLL